MATFAPVANETWSKTVLAAGSKLESAIVEILRGLAFLATIAVWTVLMTGCAAPPDSIQSDPRAAINLARQTKGSAETPAISLVSHQSLSSAGVAEPESIPAEQRGFQYHVDASESLADLESMARRTNPRLRRLCQEFQAARARARYVDELPDPTIATNIFGHPIETAAGSQRANITVAQMLPWLPRLSAQAQQACFEAIALRQVYAAERLRVVADLRAAWYRLYVIQRHIEIKSANQELLETLIEVANARVSTGNAAQGDVLAGTLEYSTLEEELVTLRQRLATTNAEINRLVGRDADVLVAAPKQITAHLPKWNHPMLRELAWTQQPEIEAARTRALASRWGIEVARLKQRPDFSLTAGWYAIDDNRPPSTIVDVGKDAWSLGAMMSVPLWREKYSAMEREARWKHAAAHSSVEEVKLQYDAILVDLWEQAQAASETARLYRQTIIPEAERTLSADQQSYSNGEVEFDRVVADFRSLLTLQLGYHRAVGQLVTAIARIQQATGVELSDSEPANAPIEVPELSTVPNPHPFDPAPSP